MLKRLFGGTKQSSSSKEAAPKQVPEKHNAKSPQGKKQPASNSSNKGGNKNRKRNPDTKPAAPAWTVDQFQVSPKEGETRFHDLDLDDRVMHAISDLGFKYCSPIQAAVLPHTLQGHDAIGKAQTGTGKTAAFLLTIISDLLKNPIEGERYVGEPRAVIIAPTRELVVQIADDAKGLCKYTDLRISTLIGGMDYQKQLARVNQGYVDIVVATPGRLLDFKSRRDLFLDQTEILVLDEADRMLDMGFIPQVKQIIRSTPRKENRQTLLFSATFTPDVMNLAEQWTYEPSHVEIEPESVATDNVDQKVYMVANEDKFRILSNIVSSPAADSVIVFANRRDQVRKLHERMQRKGISCGILSGEVPQAKRTKTLEMFKNGKLQVLVATDVAGRGIHVKGISHVVNYTLPEDPDDYVHRIGRTGRAGAKGISISFACEDDAFQLPDIEVLLGEKLECTHPPAELLK